MGSVDYFLKIDSIKGESQDAKHKDEIDVLSYSWGVTQSGAPHSGAGGGSGRASSRDFVVVKSQDRASPVLMTAAATGQHLKQVLLTARRGGGKGEEFLKIKLSEVIVSKYELAGLASDAGRPTEQIALNFTKLEMLYSLLRPDGGLEGIPGVFDLAGKKP